MGAAPYRVIAYIVRIVRTNAVGEGLPLPFYKARVVRTNTVGATIGRPQAFTERPNRGGAYTGGYFAMLVRENFL